MRPLRSGHLSRISNLTPRLSQHSVVLPVTFPPAPVPASQPVPRVVSPSFCFLPRRVYLHCHFLLKVFWLWPPSRAPSLLHMPGVVPLGYAVSCLCLFLLAVPLPTPAFSHHPKRPCSGDPCIPWTGWRAPSSVCLWDSLTSLGG